MSDTPRTDATAWQARYNHSSDTTYYVEADFARQLERELAAALKLLGEWKYEYGGSTFPNGEPCNASLDHRTRAAIDAAMEAK